MNLKAKDIAQMLGISPATVSMVLNNKAGISEERRLQIINKINELGCGQMLKKNTTRTKNLGFVVYKHHGDIISESPFFSLIIEGVNEQARKCGYTVMLIHLSRETPINQQIDQILKNECEGLVVFATEMSVDDLQIIKEIGLPFVLIDNHFVDEDVDAVCINNRQGIYKAVKHLVELGHKKIGYVQSKIQIISFQERFDVFCQTMRSFNLDVSDQYIYRISYSEEGSYRDMKRILSENKELPTAIVADNDLLAIGAMRAIKEYGFSVPQDISIVGFDDRPVCLCSEPQLTTISVSKDIFGPLAIDLLISRIENSKKTYLTVEIGVDLIERGSTASCNFKNDDSVL